MSAVRLGLALTSFFASASVLATSVRLLDEPHMVSQAAVIVRGTVVSVQGREHPSGFLVTDVTVKVERGLKGAADGSEITLVQLGGTVGGRSQRVVGATEFRVGERILLFCEQGSDSLVELGVGAGTFDIVERAGVRWVQRRVGANLVPAGELGTEVAKAAVGFGPERLDQVEARILSYVGLLKP